MVIPEDKFVNPPIVSVDTSTLSVILLDESLVRRALINMAFRKSQRGGLLFFYFHVHA